ncbi:Na+/H+ antiporter NhaA [Ottowia caeni]|uniref:Na+/H+ antiporter NhaA n=1 Tax=Ottowia caeni TaxID=2870339 RepID=UPI001E501493|nr:Na+/H+ antiporter NhaA [Ottowia caeni]
MNRNTPRQDLPRAQLLAERAFATLERFLHIEAASGVVLLIAAAVALIWANSSFTDSYHALWHLPVTFGIGDLTFSQSLHFIINDGLMTIFFLVVGMEIRREIHEGALSNMRQASLPIMAALGGVVVPALIYVALNTEPSRLRGWAVPTATDIAFAVGVLALLGRGIPSNVRVFLLALAIIDDIIAVLIIALFYSGGLDLSGFLVAAMGILVVLSFQRMGIGSAFAYVLPGGIVWIGLLMTGAHPTLAGVVLGMLTPVLSRPTRERPLDMVEYAAQKLRDHDDEKDAHHLNMSIKQLRLAQRELLPPVVRVQTALHPWVAFGIMPIFALANAGVSIDGIDLSAAGPQWVMMGIALALVLGKPLGIVGISWLMVRLGWCQLPPGVSWGSVLLIGLLAGVGFTMSIFIAMLAFESEALLGAAKLGVLAGSLVAALLGLAWGAFYQRLRPTT